VRKTLITYVATCFVKGKIAFTKKLKTDQVRTMPVTILSSLQSSPLLSKYL